MIAYLLMVGSGLRIAIQAERTFEKLLATGLTTILGIQAFVIIGGVTRVVPLTGVTLPFVSYGGSSPLANYVLLALLMRIADSSAVQRPHPPPHHVAPAASGAPGGQGGGHGRGRPRPRRPHGTRRSGGRAGVNRQIRTLGIGLMVLFVALFIQLNVVQVVRADRYDADPGNNRTVVRDFTRPRGSIVTADGAVMAESVPTGDRYRYQRRYPTGELFANVSGYFSFTLGSTQLERTQNATLSGTTSRSSCGSGKPVQRRGQHR
jgi:peptidoglycan glycosyltransferase